MNYDATTEFADVPAGGLVVGPVEVLQARVIALMLSTYGLNGATALTAVIDGSDDASTWLPLVTADDMAAMATQLVPVTSPPKWLRVRYGVDAPLDFSGTVEVATTFPIDAPPPEPVIDPAELARQQFQADLARSWQPASHNDPTGSMAPFAVEP